MQNMEKKIHNFTDLGSCYDGQLSNVRGVVEEAVGVERMSIKLLTKITPWLNYFTNTNFRISEETHGGRNDPLVGLWQGMVLYGARK